MHPAIALAALLSIVGLADARRIRLQPLARAALLERLEGAGRRLAQPACDAILDEFSDRDGSSLRQVLGRERLPATAHLLRVVFADGQDERQCRRPGVFAFTSPGSRVVFVCADRFRGLSAREPEHAEAVVIHELLHTLGLGEDPPTSLQITARVRERCVP